MRTHPRNERDFLGVTVSLSHSAVSDGQTLHPCNGDKAKMSVLTTREREGVMFKEQCTEDAKFEFQLYTDCETVLNVHSNWCDWLIEGTDGRFRWRKSADGEVEVTTPCGSAFGRVTLVQGERGVAIARVVFFHQFSQRFRTDPVAVFAVRIDENWGVRSGDQPNARLWSSGLRSHWHHKERERLGYEVFLGQLKANEQVGAKT